MCKSVGSENQSSPFASAKVQGSLPKYAKVLLWVVIVGSKLLGESSTAYAHHLNGRNYWYWTAPARTIAQGLVPNPSGGNDDQLIAGSYFSESMEHTVGYMIYLPPDYDPDGTPYPVIYFLHGLNGNELSYFSGSDGYTTSASLYGETNLISLIAAAHNSAQPRDTIVVFVNGGSRSFYVDYDSFNDINGEDHHSSNIAPRYPNGAGDPFPNPWPDDTQDFRLLSRTTIIEELIPHIDASYNTITNRSGRAIEGFSMGGGGAWRLALQHPELFCSSVAYAPAGLDRILQPFNPTYAGPLLPRDAASTVAESNSDALIANDLKLRMVTGAMDDSTWYNDGVAVRDALVENGLPMANIDIAGRPAGVGHSNVALNNAAGEESFDFHWDCFEEAEPPPLPLVRFSNANYNVAENVGSTTITVNLSATSSEPVTVTYLVQDGTAQAGEDYSNTSALLTFAPNDTAAQFTVPIVNDDVVEADETVNLLLSTPINAALGTPDSAVLTIVDNDEEPSPVLPTLTVQNASVVEGDSGNQTAALTVTLSSASEVTVTVAYSTTDGTATMGEDYTAANGVVTFAAGEPVEMIALTIHGDSVDENNETLLVSLSNPVSATLGTPDSAVLTIVDNDEEPSPVLPTLTVQDASVVEGDSGNQTATLTVTLSSASEVTVTVAYSTADGTAASHMDYTLASGVVAFAPGETTQSIALTIHGDSVDENNETVLASLSNPVNATLGIPSSATLTIVDNDEEEPTPNLPALTMQNASVVESDSGSQTAILTATLSSTSEVTVTVAYSTTDGTATEGEDYTATNGVVTFAAGEPVQTIALTIHGDSVDENNETVLVSLSNPVNAALGAPSNAVLTIVDNDEEPTPVLPTLTVQNGSVVEGDSGNQTATLTVTLSSASEVTVTVAYSTTDGTATSNTDYAATNGVLIFAPGETTQSIAITIQDDSVDENNETVLVSLSNPVSATLGTPSNGTLTIIDDDEDDDEEPSPVLPTLTVQDASMVEGDSGNQTATLTVTLSSASEVTVTVGYATADGTASSGADYLAASEEIVFVPGQTTGSILITVNGDEVDEVDETILVSLSNPVNADLGTLADAILTIINDDEDDDGEEPTPDLPTLTVQSVGSVEGDSGTQSVSLPVTLSATSNPPVTVAYVTADGTTTSDVDYAATNGVLVFAPGQTNQAIIITIHGDSVDEDNETILVSLSNPVNATLGAPANAILTIIDDDPPSNPELKNRVYLPSILP